MADKAKEKDPGEVTLLNVRLSFAHIFTPQEQESEEVDPKTGQKKKVKKYSARFLMPKEGSDGKQSKNYQNIVAAAARVKKAKWKDSPPKLKADRVCLRDGDEEDYDGYADNWFVGASNVRQPSIVDRNKRKLEESDGRPYSGCYVNAVIRLWGQDNKYGKRINASLEAIQFVKDGEAFGARPVDPNEAFQDLGGGDDGLDPIGAGDEDDDSGLI